MYGLYTGRIAFRYYFAFETKLERIAETKATGAPQEANRRDGAWISAVLQECRRYVSYRVPVLRCQVHSSAGATRPVLGTGTGCVSMLQYGHAHNSMGIQSRSGFTVLSYGAVALPSSDACSALSVD
jgi:hypothetical protein